MKRCHLENCSQKLFKQEHPVTFSVLQIRDVLITFFALEFHFEITQISDLDLFHPTLFLLKLQSDLISNYVITLGTSLLQILLEMCVVYPQYIHE